MIKSLRQYRAIPSFDEVMQAEQAKPIPSFDEVMGNTSKKKDVSVGGQNSNATSQNTSSTSASTQNQNSYDPYKSALSPFRQQLQEAQGAFDPLRNRAVSDQTRQAAVPFDVRNQQFQQSDYSQKQQGEKIANANLQQAQAQIHNQLSNVHTAKQVLNDIKEKHGGVIPQENETAPIAQQAVENFNTVNKDNQLVNQVKDSKDVVDFVKKYSGALLPNQQAVAAKTWEVLNDPNVEEAFRQNPDKWKSYINAKSDFNNLFPDAAKQRIASQVAEWMNDSKEGGGLVSTGYDKKALDAQVEKQFKEGHINANDRAFYYQHVKPEDVPTTAVANIYGRNFEQSMRNSFLGRALSGVGLLENPIEKYQYKAHVEPTSLLGKGAELGGQLTPLILTNAALKGAGFSDKAANIVSAVNQFGPNNQDKGDELFPNDPAKKWAYTILGTGIDALATELPIFKNSPFKSEAESLASTLADKTISQEAKQQATKTFLGRVEDFAKDAVKNTAHGAGVLTGINTFHQFADVAAKAPNAVQNLEHTNPLEEFLNNAKSYALLGIAGSAGKLFPEAKAKEPQVENKPYDSIFPKTEENGQPTDITTPTTDKTGAEVRDTKDEQAGVNTTDNGLQDGNGGGGKDVGGKGVGDLYHLTSDDALLNTLENNKLNKNEQEGVSLSKNKEMVIVPFGGKRSVRIVFDGDKVGETKPFEYWGNDSPLSGMEGEVRTNGDVENVADKIKEVQIDASHYMNDTKVDDLVENLLKYLPKDKIKITDSFNGEPDKAIYNGKFKDLIKTEPTNETSNTISTGKEDVGGEKVDEPSDEFSNFKNHVLDTVLNVKDNKFDHTFSFDMDYKTREQAVRNIKEGKDTKAAQQMLKEIKQMYDDGYVYFNRGRGDNTERIQIPIKDYMAEVNKPFVPETDLEHLNTLLGEDSFNDTFDKHYNDIQNETEREGTVSETPTTTATETATANPKITSGESESNTTPKQPIEPTNEGQSTSQKPPVEEGGGSEEKTTGIAQRVREDRADLLNIESSPIGEGWSKEDALKHGNDLLDKGFDVDNELEQFKQDGKLSPDLMAAAQAKAARLAKETNRLGDADPNSEEYKQALKAEKDFLDKVKPLQTAWSKMGAAQQGDINIDTGSFTAVKKAVEANSGKPATKEQEKKIKDLTAQNEALRKRAEEAEAKLILETDKALKEANKAEKTTASEKAKTIANKLRKAKIHKPDSFSAATPASIVWDAAVETVAKSIEAGGEIADAIQKGVKYIKNTDWYKSLSDDKKKQAEDDFVKWHNQNTRPLDSSIESLWNRFENKSDTEFTKEESKALWDYTKENYLDKGIPYKEALENVANDTGLSWRQVMAAVTPKYNKHLISVSDAMWKQKSDLRRHQTATNNWIENQSRNYALRAFRRISGTFRGAAVFGHGAIFVGTHSGMTLFDIPKVKHTLKAFLNGYKFAYGKTGNYERMMEDLKHSPNYILAQRAGLKNNPDNIDAEEYQKSQKYLGKLAGAGERGFNAIKVLRQNLFDYEYKRLSSVEKADPKSAEAIAWLINNATGATNLKIPDLINEVTFAGGMEAARWGKLTRNPMRATSIALKALINSKGVPVDEKVFAKVWARRVGTQLGTLAGMIAVNAAMQQLINPSNPVNYKDPNKPDFGKFKFGDITIDPTSGMRSAANFIFGLGKIPFESKKQLHGDSPLQSAGKQTSGYMRGKLSPFYSTIADFYNKSDFKGNPMPFSSDKPTVGHHKLSWGEYLWQKAPLPVAEAATEMYNQALNSGASKVGVNHAIDGIISGGLSGATGFRVGEYVAEEHNHSPFTEEDKKDPTFKYFIDKGMELPNVQNSSEVITDEENKTKKKLSEYPKDVQDKYDEAHKKYLKEELATIKDNGSVYVKEYTKSDGTKEYEVYDKSTKGAEEKNLSQLSKEEMAEVLSTAQKEATKKAKKEVFNNE